MNSDKLGHDLHVLRYTLVRRPTIRIYIMGLGCPKCGGGTTTLRRPGTGDYPARKTVSWYECDGCGASWIPNQMIRSRSYCWCAVAEHNGNDDVAPMFAQAKKVAGKIPTTLISYKAANFHHAWEKQYRAKNFLYKDT